MLFGRKSEAPIEKKGGVGRSGKIEPEGAANLLSLKLKTGELLRKGDYEKALEELGRLLESRPRDASLLNSRGDILLKAGRIREAVSQYELAAEYYIRDFFHGKAIAVCKKILRVQPENALPHQLLGELYEQQGLKKEAAEHLFRYAVCLEKTGQVETSTVIYARVLTLDPSNAAARESLARLGPGGLMQRGPVSTEASPPASAPELRVGEGKEVPSPPTDIARDIPELEEGLHLGKEEKLPAPPAPAAERPLEFERLPTFMPPAAEQPPEMGETRTQEPPLIPFEAKEETIDGEEMGDLLLEIGSVREAVEQYEQSSEARLSRGDLKGAQKLLRKIAELRPQELRPRQKIVEIALNLEDRDSLLSAYIELGECLLRKDNPEQAMVIFQRILEIDPQSPEARARLSHLLPPGPDTTEPGPEVETRPGPEATVSSEPPRQELEIPLSETPSPTPGVEQVFPGRPIIEAGKESRVRFSVTGDVPLSEESISMEEIVREFKEGVKRGVEEEDSQTHYDLGVAYMEAGLTAEALREFQVAALDPRMKLRSVELLGKCYLEQGDIPSALGTLEGTLKDASAYNNHELLGIRYQLAQSYEKAGDLTRAKEELGIILSVDPTFGEAAQKLRQMGA